jgi:hypothetical protein
MRHGLFRVFFRGETIVKRAFGHLWEADTRGSHAELLSHRYAPHPSIAEYLPDIGSMFCFINQLFAFHSSEVPPKYGMSYIPPPKEKKDWYTSNASQLHELHAVSMVGWSCPAPVTPGTRCRKVRPFSIAIGLES